MKPHIKYMVLLLCATTNLLQAQEEPKLVAKDSIVKSSWIIGLGYNIVDDSGDVFDELLAPGDQWNVLPYPSRISIGRYFDSGIGVEAIGTYNKYAVGKFIDGRTNLEETDYYGIDARLTYDLNKIIGQTGWFDPYLGVGAGYTEANNEPRATYNAVVGFRTWFSDRLGLDFSSSGKWAANNDQATNHLQHAAGVVYQFGITKGLSKKGEAKLALIEELDAQRQKQQDSIAAAEREREEADLAARLAKEKEEARLAAAEKARLDALKQRETEIRNEIDALGFAYFDLNSSYLNAKSKKVLDGLADILAKYPELELQITSHTDSRGTSAYNDWLSERRVTHTKAYLVKRGVSAERLDTEAYGETHLLNECDDNTYCDEEKHQENRRSEFVITKF
ncbi:OmpA family protein [Zobellia galactanivorans]|uniref:OmpA family protein n=1 Tax=Zobellia galactanivorans (strain DSM 12802 / CCUG 47099 / CIP 106680 / NCIMB 13871 / Dsij) TaxID=63186 RepID=UPI001C0672B9|nr:OmpA family protein [Zobellia galactanivorans]MBU3024397.1 OmpA family protein [Zobellia galactanivorans]